MSFQEVLAEVSTQLTAIGALTPTILVGKKYRFANEALRRIVFVPTSDSFEPVSNPGGNPRPILDVLVGADVHIWADDYYLAAALRDQFILALHRAVKRPAATPQKRGGEYKISKGEWTNETDHDQLGAEYTLSVSIKIPILERTFPALPTPATDLTALTNPKVPSGTKMVTNVAANLGGPPPTAQGGQNINGPTTP